MSGVGVGVGLGGARDTRMVRIDGVPLTYEGSVLTIEPGHTLIVTDDYLPIITDEELAPVWRD